MVGEVFRAVGDLDALAFGEDRESPRQFGCTGLLMMSERLAIGRDHDGRAFGLRVGHVGEPVRQSPTVGEQVAECDLARELTLETEYRETEIVLPPFEGTDFAAGGRITDKTALTGCQNR